MSRILFLVGRDDPVFGSPVASSAGPALSIHPPEPMPANALQCTKRRYFSTGFPISGTPDFVQ
jgi:hypothetical protein